jgi:hypothetical protein
MGIPAAKLIEYYPRLYHMAESDSWDSIRVNGLRSTTALLDLYEVDTNLRFSIESRRRATSVEISHRLHGKATIRDQIPLREKTLRLEGMTPQQWYEMLNRKVFFWLTRDRLVRLLLARAYRGRRHTVITVDTARLIESQGDGITLSAINSGSTIYNAPPRGVHTFLPLERYPYDARKKLRGVKGAIAELAVDYNVPDIAGLAVSVEHMEGTSVTEVLHRQRCLE